MAEQLTQAFRVRVIHGDYQTGRRHFFRVAVKPRNKIHAYFDMRTEAGAETLEMDELVRFEQTIGRFRVGDWLEHYLLAQRSMKAARTSLAHFQEIELESRQVRFVCTTESKYFCGEMPRNGFRMALQLIQQTKQAE